MITFLDGFKTYIAAAGLLGVALVQAFGPVPNYPLAFQSLMAALAAVGLRAAIAKTHAAITGGAP